MQELTLKIRVPTKSDYTEVIINNLDKRKVEKWLFNYIQDSEIEVKRSEGELMIGFVGEDKFSSFKQFWVAKVESIVSRACSCEMGAELLKQKLKINNENTREARSGMKIR